MSAVAKLFVASRPISWVNTAFPFGAAYFFSTGALDWIFWLGTFFFLIPYNFLMYGVNDVFEVKGSAIDPNNFQIDIFNRWGETVYSGNDPNEAWTGGMNGNTYYLPNGLYSYYIATNSLKTGQRFEYRGYISIIR